ncbi:MAG: hypothetical protein ABI402_16550 [Ferruginibacter sp.]
MKTILAVFSIVIVFTNCSNPRYAYSPTAHNVPILAKKGDSKAAVYYSNNGASGSSDGNGNQYNKNSAQGADLQGAYAITNNIAVQANYYLRSEKTNSTNGSYNFENSLIKYKRNLFEVGAGYFTTFDKNDHLLFQVYAGAGLGKTKIKETGTDYNQLPFNRYYNTNLTKFFLEPSITFRTSKEIFAATITTRASVIRFRKIQTNYTYDEKQDFDLDSLDRYGVVFFEPSFVGSFGFNKLPGLRVEVQAGLSVLFQESFIDYRPFNFSLGLVFDIRKLMKGQVEETSRSGH